MAAVVFLALALAGCANSSDPAGPSGDDDDTVLVHYEVRGGAYSADITFVRANGSTGVDYTTSFPWSYNCGEMDAGEYLSVSASSSDPFVGAWLTVTIYKNGAQYRTATSSGSSPAVTVSGTS